ncbi:MAG TPA: ISNCY family transposase, partial [Thermodesulfovibrionia bacterium]|nr:ISNCY family transposase [Thermodesulfovibrionia bacterium]
LQMDGSHHDWFEGRCPEAVLMAYVDDATNNVYGKFYDYEGTFPAMDSFKNYAKQYGIPQSLYIDRHSTYKSTTKPTIEEELNNTKPLSQFERAMKELGVKVIHALSPQGKGRVERVFGTFQDRVIKEMRLKGVSSVEEGNEFLKEYLPEFNKKFGCKPMKEENLHRSMPKEKDIEDILCIKTKRTLAKDYTVSHNKKLYQILDKVRTKHVIVEEKLDGSIVIKHDGRNLRLLEITTRPVKVNQKIPCVYKFRSKYVPPKDHPWRRYSPSIYKRGHF